MTNKHTKSRDNIILKEGDDTTVDKNNYAKFSMITLQILLPPLGLKMLLLVLMMPFTNTMATQFYQDQRKSSWTQKFYFSSDKINERLKVIDIKSHRMW